MEGLIGVVIIFCLSLSAGTQLFLPLADPKATGNGLYRLFFSLIGAFFLISFAFKLSLGLNHVQLLWPICFLLLVVSYFINHEKRQTRPMVFLFGLLLAFLLYQNAGTGTEGGFFILTALYSGVVFFAMLLGHWYLVTPKLSERPLLLSMKWLWLITLIRGFFVTRELLAHEDYFISGTELGSGYLYNVIFTLMRLSFGYLAVLIFSYLGYRCTKIRSIQSATGIFYVMVFFMFVGEVISLFMHFELGISL